MKKYFKKLLVTLLAAVSVVCLAAGLVACGDGGSDDPGEGAKVSLIAPVLDLSGDVLSWQEVAHATGYTVYENGKSVSEQTETSYIIKQDYPGTYEYTVKATTTEKGYSDSPVSAAKSFTVKPYKLNAPVISIDSDTGIISWAAVEHADGYEIYENRELIDTVTEYSYTILQTNPAVFAYTVRAISTDAAYSISDHSNSEEYKVPLHAVVAVEFPTEFEGEVTVSLCKAESGAFVAETKVVRDESELGTSNYGTGKFVVEWGNYVAKITGGLTDEYVATWARVSTERRNGSIAIHKNSNTLQLGKQTVTASIPANEDYVTVEYIFIAGHSDDGAHSIIIDEGVTGLQISAAGKTIINTDQNAYKGSFNTAEGEVIIISATFIKPAVNSQEPEDGEVGAPGEEPTDVQVSFEIEIVNYEEKIPLRILPEPYNLAHFTDKGYGSYVNEIYDSCVRYVDVEKSGTYEFFFLNSKAHNSFIALTVGDKSFNLSGGGIASVYLKAGDRVRVQIDVTNVPDSDFLTLFVYNMSLNMLPEPYDGDRYEEAGYDNYANVIYDSCTRYIAVEEPGTYEFFFNMPTDSYVSITLTINGVKYEAMADGIIRVQFTADDLGTEAEIELSFNVTGVDEVEGITFFVYGVN